MPRQPLQVRDAVPEDGTDLVRLWTEAGYPIDAPDCGSAELASALAQIAADPEQRIVVGEYDGRVVAALHMRRAPIGPLTREDAVHTAYLAVLPAYRRHGYARAMLEAAVSWAEEKDSSRVTAITTSTSRDTNRFLARLGLSTLATLRVAPTAGLRARLSPSPRSTGSRAIGKVLAERRASRRTAARA